MSLIGGIKKSFNVAFIAGSLALPSCGTDITDLNAIIPTQAMTEIDYLIAEMINIDGDFQPELENNIEIEYNINILGKPENLNDESLKETAQILSSFNRQKITGLNIILGESGSIDPSNLGKYFSGSIFGDIIFAKFKTESNLNENKDYGLTNEDILKHEIFHHIHDNLPNKWRFNNSWYNIKTKIVLNGSINEVTTKEAIQLMELYNSSSFLIKDRNGIGHPFENGIGGFIRPYSIEGNLNPEDRDNSEDIATFAEILDDDFTDLRLQKGIAFWDPSFDVNPYLDKIELLKENNFINANTANRVTKKFNVIDEAFSDIRDPTFFSRLESEILQIYNPSTLENPEKGMYAIKRDNNIVDNIIIDVKRYDSDLQEVSRTFVVNASWQRNYPNNPNDELTSAIFLEYSGYLYFDGTMDHMDYFTRINVNYPTSPVDNSKILEDFVNIIESPQWVEEFERLKE